ncbi:MAG: bifunctional glutamate N-acetyltransferase/amino-acid acetyltransferase ArgJ [Spirochaetales bacterium]|nr:bifunctional glutamate N-acetyltransferase/amino-acid acetyltransferase ArgJ [Spirochaetales bacterium]
MEKYDSIKAYEIELKKRAVLPEGFKTAATSFTFFPRERPVKTPLKMNLSLLLADRDVTSFGAVFTKNLFPGGPILIGKKRMTGASVRGILINNKIANVCAASGVKDAESVLLHLAGLLGISGTSLLPASTGIIGWQLPMAEIKQNLQPLVEHLSTNSLFDVAKAIMTTDSFPKIRTITIGDGRITAIAKGAGMIEPNLATMLVFILTDIEISRELLQTYLTEAAHESFNTISIDGDQSTSDMAVILSSCKKKPTSTEEFRNALFSVCKSLAEDIVRNGEGTSHVIKVLVKGNDNKVIRAGIGKGIINSPLVKTAIFGNDPNVGRIIGAIGDFLGNHQINIDTGEMTLKLGDTEIFSKGAFLINPDKERTLSDYLKNAQLDPSVKGYPQHNKTVDITVILGEGDETSTIIGSDLSYEYIRENADYRS